MLLEVTVIQGSKKKKGINKESHVVSEIQSLLTITKPNNASL